MPTDNINQTDASHDGLNVSSVWRDCVTCAIVAIDAQARITAFNPAAERFLDLPASLALGRPLNVLPAVLAEHLRNTLATGQPAPDALLELPLGPAITRSFRATITPTGGAPGSMPTGAIAVLHDLAAAKNLERALVQLDRLASLGTLSASLAHEVKNALVALKTFVDLLLKNNREAELAAMAEHEVQRIDSLITQMLDYASPKPPASTHVRVHEVLEQTLALLQHHVAGRGVILERSFAAAPDLIRGDAGQLEQAFLNLLLNSLEALGATGRITIATELAAPTSPPGALVLHDQPPMLRISIRDTGSGIPPDVLGHLFEPFFTTKLHGTGLGLPITRRIVQSHQGTIEVHSEPNQGTTFSITLPLAPRQY